MSAKKWSVTWSAHGLEDPAAPFCSVIEADQYDIDGGELSLYANGERVASFNSNVWSSIVEVKP